MKYLLNVLVVICIFNVSSAIGAGFKEKFIGNWVGSAEFTNISSTWCAAHMSDGQLKVLFKDVDLTSGKAFPPVLIEGTWSVNGNYLSNSIRVLDLDGNYIQKELQHEKYKILKASDDFIAYQGLRQDKTVFESSRVENCSNFLRK